MDCADLCQRLDEELSTAAYADLDASANGLQVESKTAEVGHVAFAVDAAREPIDRAVEAGADLLIVHHGLSWGGIERVTGHQYRRLEPLLSNGVGLYVSHLPLDGHQDLGNAAGVADVLGLVDREPFGAVGPEFIGQRGTLEKPVGVERLAGTLEDALDTGTGRVRTLDFGPEVVEDVAIVTGSGVDWLEEAIDAGADLLVTGEGKAKVYHEARESGVNVLLAGHYATETFGVKSLADLVAEWGLETTIIDCPTGL